MHNPLAQSQNLPYDKSRRKQGSHPCQCGRTISATKLMCKTCQEWIDQHKGVQPSAAD